MQVQAEDPNIIYEVTLPLRPYREGSSAWLSPSVERSIIGIALDERMCHSGHLGGHGGQCLAPQIPVKRIAGDVTRELLAKIILALTHGNLAGHPEGAAKPCVTVLRKFAMTSEAA